MYSAVDRIVEAFEGKGTKAEAVAVKELVDKNVFGLDVEEFPLFLAEMCILLRQLPLIVNILFAGRNERQRICDRTLSKDRLISESVDSFVPFC